MSTSPDDLPLVREMAAKLNCLVEQDFATLAGATAGTVETWRKRGVGPRPVRLGTRYLYPVDEIAKHIKSLTVPRTSGKGVL